MKVVTSLDLKIASFLRQVGYPADLSAASSIELVRYFEQEFGCHVLGLLEREYWEEQVAHDLEDGLFGFVRHHVAEERRAAFDACVSALLATEVVPAAHE